MKNHRYMYLIRFHYQNVWDSINGNYKFLYPLSNKVPRFLLAYSIDDAISIVFKHFYHLQLCDFKRGISVENLIVKKGTETYLEFMEILYNNKKFHISSKSNDIIVFYKPFVDDYKIIYEISNISHTLSVQKVLDDAESVSLTRKENDELRKRNAFLECEPYRGPDFFKMLKEEIKDGLIEKID